MDRRISALEAADGDNAPGGGEAVIGVGPAVVTTAAPGPNVPVELVTAAAARAAALAGSPNDAAAAAALSAVPIYVESPNGELASVVATSGGAASIAPGSPNSAGLQLTTITVAVPAPLSPNDPAFLAAAAAANQSTPPPPAAGGSIAPSAVASLPPPTTIALPTVPAPQETTFKWKYEQNKDKASSGGATSNNNNNNHSSTVSSAVGTGNSSLVSIHPSIHLWKGRRIPSRDSRRDCDKKEQEKRRIC